ncbi:hypothetical protein D9758_000349 [Tetrapyrgos nigripes]|uniref:Cobalamin-independent methionine synthase MetE C-terminal/archaeal domain-containing protein n=1 Tax=Tetrapyrgos nigripes TaxID=182062 RepID=A0A8H5H278_9AGAR|nr:hypothetical protein D9758_000349 [Tetrapyrgos nigripes]
MVLSANSRSNPPFRVEHVGSFLRPKALYDHRALLNEGKAPPEDLRILEDQAIRSVVDLQQELGIKGVTDGEMRREQFFDGIFERLEGLTFIPMRPVTEFKGKIKRTQPFYVEDFKFMKTLVAPEDVKDIKVGFPSPSWIHQRHGSDWTYDLNVYKSDDEYFEDVAAAYREEIQELYDLGCRNIQIDDPTFTFFCWEPMLAGMREDGVNPDVLLDTYIQAVNLVTAGRPKDLHISVHMCRGNVKGMSFCEGSYGPIAEKVFNKLDVDTLYLEYDNEHSGDFEPLKHVPADKNIVLGLVTTKVAKLEDPEELVKRVHEAATAMVSDHRSKEDALNQICISPQCGFASVWEGNPITEEDERKKLAVLQQASKMIWSD